MECIEARALKSGFLSELAMKSTQEVSFDDLLCPNGISGVSCDDFSVDVYLDLSNKDFKDELVEEESEEEEEKDSLSLSSQDRVDDDNSDSSAFSGTGDSGSLSAGELAVPQDDVENLEWLSQFVDDSVSELSLLFPAGNFKEKTGSSSENWFEPAIHRTPFLSFPSPVPAKARSKRSRPSGRAWSLCSPSLSESSSSSTSSSVSSSTSIFTLSNSVQTMDFAHLAPRVVKPPTKRQKKTPAGETGGETVGSLTQRRCSHCQVQKTPQWRTGPLGAKTLCNACGVRYKSGRLFPEYRPACSPTFLGDIHSNSHRKVLEMRRQKELTVVPSF